MKRKAVTVLLVGCCLAEFAWMYYLIAERRQMPEADGSTVRVSVKVYGLGYVRPGCRVGFAAALGSTNTSFFVDDLLVVAINDRDKTVTVQVSPEQARRLALVEGSILPLCGRDALEPPWWKKMLAWSLSAFR